jgi:translation initiation factor 2B subunit (eIF-2B alpha/beta/delta family)
MSLENKPEEHQMNLEFILREDGDIVIRGAYAERLMRWLAERALDRGVENEERRRMFKIEHIQELIKAEIDLAFAEREIGADGYTDNPVIKRKTVEKILQRIKKDQDMFVVDVTESSF